MRKLLINLSVLTVLVVVAFSPVLYFNLYIDPYGVFRKDFTRQRIEPNSHFIKMRYLLNHPDEYDSFIFGNSRANNIECPSSAALTDGKWYNLYYSLGVPREHLADLQLLERHSIKIKNILLCLDMSSYMNNYDDREMDALRRPYPGNLFTRLRYYIYYAFRVPDMDFLQRVMATEQNDIYREISLTGRARNLQAENSIKLHPEAHNTDGVFDSPMIMGESDFRDQLLMDINGLIDFCKLHSINIKILVNPIYKTTLLANNFDMYLDFLKRLSVVTDYYDFTGINKITSNNYFYYETSHFRPIVGQAMINFVYQGKRIDSVPDFGFYVTKQNIESHLATLRGQAFPLSHNSNP